MLVLYRRTETTGEMPMWTSEPEHRESSQTTWARAILKSSSSFHASKQIRKRRPEGVIEGDLVLIPEGRPQEHTLEGAPYNVYRGRQTPLSQGREPWTLLCGQTLVGSSEVRSIFRVLPGSGVPWAPSCFHAMKPRFHLIHLVQQLPFAAPLVSLALWGLCTMHLSQRPILSS